MPDAVATGLERLFSSDNIALVLSVVFNVWLMWEKHQTAKDKAAADALRTKADLDQAIAMNELSGAIGTAAELSRDNTLTLRDVHNNLDALARRSGL